MRLPSVRLGHWVFIFCAVLALVGGWALGSRKETVAPSQTHQTPIAAEPPLSSTAPVAQPAPLPAPISAELPTLSSVPTRSEVNPVVTAASPVIPVTPPPASNALDMASLRSRTLTLPVRGTTPPQLNDTFTQARANGLPHDALDIMAPRGTPVVAIEDGRVAKLFLSKAGGITLYQFDPDNRYAYYYAHLDRYADDVTEGATVRKGQVIGYVGSTGNASPDAPHLHFAIFKLEPERQWWRGAPLNPYLVWRDAKP